MATARLEELRAKFQENPRRFFAPFANELRKSGDAAQAIAICRTHLAGQPGHVSGHIVLAQALHDSGALDEASQEFQAALEVDPENMIALRAAGDICAAKSDFVGARAWYERVLDVDPRNDEMLELLRTLPEPATVEAAIPAADVDALAPTETVTPTDASTEAALTGALEFLPAGARETADAGHSSESIETESFAEAFDQAAEPVEEIELSESFSARQDEPVEVGSVDVESADYATAAINADQNGNAAPEYAESSPSTESASDVDAADTLELELPELASATSSAAPEPEAAPNRSDPALAEPGSHDDGSTVDLPMEWFTPTTPAPPTSPDMASADWALPEPAAASAPALEEVAEPATDSPPASEGETGWRPKPTPAAVHSDFEAAPDDWFSLPADVALDRPGEPSIAAEVGSIAAPRDDLASWFPVAAEAPPAARSDDSGGAPGALEPAPVEGEEVGSTFEAPEPPVAEPYASEPTTVEPVVAESTDEPAGGIDVAAEEVLTPLDGEAYAGDAFADLEADVLAPGPTEPEHVSAEWGAAPVPPESEGEPAVEPLARESTATGSADVAAARPTPASSSVVPEAAAVPFVTETLAELYVQQGFREEALAIYRQLLIANPADASLRQRAEEIEGMVNAPAAAAESTDVPALPAPIAATAGLSVRAFFGRLARRKPGPRLPTDPTGAPSAAGERSADPGTSAASTPGALNGGETGPLRESGWPPSAPSSALASERSGIALSPESAVRSAVARQTPSALAALFPASNPSSADLAAATSLAGAFSEPPSESHPPGRPARTVDRELSLDHLFRDISPASGQGVTLDSFFGAGPGDRGSGAVTQAHAPQGDTPDDLQQFTKWLEGLKQK